MAETVTMPKLGFDMAEGTLVRWVKQEGEPINKGEILAEIETDKATVEVESHTAGTILRLLVNQGDTVPVSTPIAVIGVAGEQVAANKDEEGKTGARSLDKTETDGESVLVATQQEMVPAAQFPPVPASGPVKASPLARKMAQQENVDLGGIQGSGPGGRVVRRDIESTLANRSASSPVPIAAPLSPDEPVSLGEEIVKMSRLRQAIARRMSEAKQSAPHFYITHEYRMDALLDLRRQLNDLLLDDAKLSVNDFILKATALTLKEFPNLNASFAGQNIIRHVSINIGVAVSVEAGLLTVVCRDADRKPLREIATEVKAMAGRAREGKVHPEDIEGSTFSVSNLGMYGVDNFVAIINPPEAAILALGAAREVPVVENGELKVGWRMKATISVDHRVSDGAEAARFMQGLAEFIEIPLRLLL